MSKQDLINKVAKDRSIWPIEARICEQLWNITKSFRETGLLQDYIDNKLTLDDIDIKIKENGCFNYILKLKQECYNLAQRDNINITKNTQFHYIQTLTELGTILANDCSNWWSRFETITGVMGVECVLSIRTAESLFNRDPNAPKLKQTLMQLIGGLNVL